MNTKLTLLAIATIIGSLSPVDGDKYQNLRGRKVTLYDYSTELVEEESAGSTHRARISFAGKDTQLSDYSTKLVEEESGSTEWPLVPTSHFFTYGKGHEKKPQGDWYYPHHNGEMVVHMSRPPHAKCTLSGGSGPYNFGEGHLHKDGHYCKNTKCWVFPVCSPIHGHGKGNTGTCTWGHGQHQDCHVLIMQTEGHTYYHKTLQKELSKTDWKPYK